VLVIEDSPTFLEVVRAALQRGGYTVLSAPSGERGLRLAAMHRPAALIVDGQLPGMDGPTVIRRIRLDQALRSMPCLLLTGSDARDAELQALDAGADAFVRKDGNLDVVLARLGAVLRRSGGAPEELTPLLSPKRILVVDDSEIYLQAIATALRSDGHEVVTAGSGEAALEVLAAQAMDCILLDVEMPGLGGMETCRQIKASAQLREVPVIMVTASSGRAAMMEGLAAGADDYIVKSSELELLKARVHAQIRRKQLDDESQRRREALLRGEIDAAVARAALQEADAKAALAHELERQNRELEAFAYSVSHDLRSPLRSIDAFSLALLEDEVDALSETGRTYLRQVRASAQRMRQLIDDLMLLSRIGRTELARNEVCVSDIARTVADELASTAPDRDVDFAIRVGLVANADAGLVRVLLENLLGNAWKFTAKRAHAHIEFGAIEDHAGIAFFVQDNGAGFDRTHARNLFTPFTRLHSEQEFAGTGIGLATVHRIVDRHGGRAWAEGAVGVGATIFFTLPAA
jgi:DNA-binding response OmpR family regulator